MILSTPPASGKLAAFEAQMGKEETRPSRLSQRGIFSVGTIEEARFVRETALRNLSILWDFIKADLIIYRHRRDWVFRELIQQSEQKCKFEAEATCVPCQARLKLLKDYGLKVSW